MVGGSATAPPVHYLEVLVALPACDKCGRTDPRRMIGLMTLWFGSFVDRRTDHGYFHLCPTCYEKWVKPHFDLVQGRLAELHPEGHRLNLDGPTSDPAQGDTGEVPPARHPPGKGVDGDPEASTFTGDSRDPVPAGAADNPTAVPDRGAGLGDPAARPHQPREQG
jgi:hypothetical protein